MRHGKLLWSLFGVFLIAVAVHASFADQPASSAKIGAKAPDFTLSDQNGKQVSLKDFAGKVVVLEWTNPECKFVQRHYKEKTMANLATEFKVRDVTWLAINSSSFATNADDTKWVAEQNIAYPVLTDASGSVGHAYGATNTPDMYIIGTDGKLMYKGAIDDDPQGEKTSDRINYVHQALDEVLAGKPVTTPETKPYGCNVKYKD